IFNLAVAGLGATGIVKKLTAEGVPAFGDCQDAGEGRRKKAGIHFGCGDWRPSYVRVILYDRRAIGEVQPRDAEEKRKGQPISNYSPPAVTEKLFFSARAAVSARTNKRGRIGNEICLFSGLLKHARDGQAYYVAHRNEKGVRSRVLLNRTS